MPATQIVEHGTNADKTVLATQAIGQRSPEGVGFMWAVLNYRARELPNHPAVVPQPILVARCARGFAPGAQNNPQAVVEMGRWIFDNFAHEINISALCMAQLTLTHTTSAHFLAAYTEISLLVNANFH